VFSVSVTAGSESIPVQVALVKERAVQQSLQLTGSVTAARSARLSTSTAGLVSALHVDAGSAVTTGDVLLELDAELAEVEWQGAKAGVASARLALADARRRLTEARALAPKQSIAESMVRDLIAEVAQDEAALQLVLADAAYRKGLFERHALLAPFPGVVSTKHTELGEWVSPGQAVLTLVGTADLHIDFQLPEDYRASIGPDSTLTYTLGDALGTPRTGKIATLVPVANPDSRTLLLRVEPTGEDPALVPGLSARATLSFSSGRQGLVVPRDAIIKYPDGRVIVWRVRRSNTELVVEEKRVATGLFFDGDVEILSGLAADDRVVVRGNETLTPGQRVHLVEDKEA